MADRSTVLVTGGEGQLGSALAQLDPEQILAASRMDLDITQRQQIDKILDRHMPSVVINTAAYTNVDGAESNPDLAFRVNADGPAILSEACALRDIPLFHISTDFVFDGHKDRPYRESDPVNPINVYGKTKFQGEEWVREIQPKHLILRTSWVFASGFSNFPATIRRLAAERDVIRVVADQIGSPTPAKALAEALLTLAKKSQQEELPWGTYHLAGSPPVSRFDWARTLVEGSNCRVEPAVSTDFPAPAERPAFSALDSSLAKEKLSVEVGDWQRYVTNR